MPNDHYVPRLILRAFGSGPKRNRVIWKYDKQTDEIDSKRVEECACEDNFYYADFDQKLRGVESDFGLIHRKLQNTRKLHTLEPQQKLVVAVFVALQLYRTPGIRVVLSSLIANDAEIAKDYPNNELDPIEPSKHLHADAATDGAWFLAKEILESKSWLLLCPDGTRRFLLGDHPVILRVKGPINDWRRSMVDGAIELAIAPDLLLGFYPPQNLRDPDPLVATGIIRKHYPLSYMANDQVHRFNLQQLYKSQRYVFGASQDIVQHYADLWHRGEPCPDV